MDIDTLKRLSKPEHDEKLGDLLALAVKLVKRSRTDMKKFHDQWDRNNEVYKGIRPPDREDYEAAKIREPEKMVVPMSFAQVQTFVAFCYLLYYQNGKFFAINPTGIEDHKWRESAEITLERDLRANFWPSKLYQQLVDIARFSLGVTKHWWAKEERHLPSIAAAAAGSTTGFSGASEGMVWTKQTLFEGNRLVNISPYYFFPDTRVPLTDWRRGQFCADEREFEFSELEKLQEEEIIAGLDHVEGFDKDTIESRTGSRLPRMASDANERGKSKDHICITEIQLDLIPDRYDLGPEAFHVRYLLWIANDKRIVRMERMGYAHQSFTWDVAQFSPDMHMQIGLSLADVIFNLQDVITWLINSRIWSVKRGIDGRIVADPDGIDADSLENRKSPVIWMKRSAPRLGIDTFIKQLDYVDTTANHLSDVQFLTQLINAVTGINENAMGQFHPGRRSATEARAVQAGAAGRMKLQASLIWHDAMAPMGRKMLLNQRQGMSLETYSEIVGITDPEIQLKYMQFHVPDLGKLARSEDFFVFDSTLESEKGFVAQSIQELVSVILTNPESAQLFGLNPQAMIEEVMELRGVGDIKRFSLSNGLTPAPLIPGAPPVPGLPQPIQGVPGLPPSPEGIQ